MATGQDVVDVREVVGGIVDGVIERVVRDKGGKTPVDRAVNGSINVRGKVDSGDKDGDGSKKGGSKYKGSKMPVEEGKYNEKKWEGYRREDGMGGGDNRR